MQTLSSIQGSVGESEVCVCAIPGHEVIFKIKIKRNDWLLADTCPQAADLCALF